MVAGIFSPVQTVDVKHPIDILIADMMQRLPENTQQNVATTMWTRISAQLQALRKQQPKGRIIINFSLQANLGSDSFADSIASDDDNYSIIFDNRNSHGKDKIVFVGVKPKDATHATVLHDIRVSETLIQQAPDVVNHVPKARVR